MSRVLVSLAVAWLMTPLAPVRSEPQPSIPLQVTVSCRSSRETALRTKRVWNFGRSSAAPAGQLPVTQDHDR
jgi:hypothetical protein